MGDNTKANVTDAFMEWLYTVNCTDDIKMHALDSAERLIRARDEAGFEKWHRPFTTNNGTDPMFYAMNEMGDLLQYCMSARMQGKDLTPIRELLPILAELVRES